MPISATSESGDAILKRLADRSASEVTTVVELAGWLDSGGCPGDAARRAAWSTLELVAKSHEGLDLDSLGADESGGDPDLDRGRMFKEIVLPDNPATVAAITLRAEEDAVVIHYRSRVSSPDGAVTTTIESASSVVSCAHLLNVWNNLPQSQRPAGGFPLDVLYQAWLARPRLVAPSERVTGRILPAKLAQVSPSDHRAGSLFTAAGHFALTPEHGSQLAFVYPDVTDQQASIMPGFQDAKTVGPCLPLALYDLGDAPSVGPGPSAPLPLRIFVEAVLAVPLESRDGPAPVVIEITLRRLLDSLYPGNRRARPSEYWRRLMSAFEELESPAARVPFVDPNTGQGGMRRIVNITSVPRSAGDLDDNIRIIVDLPPGSGYGPQVSDNLRQWGVKSSGAYRALLNLAYHWFEPGRTHMPVGRGSRKRWVRVNDPDRYPEMDNDTLISLCFPSSATRARRNLAVRARNIIRQLHEAGELRIVEARRGAVKVLPPAPTGNAS